MTTDGDDASAQPEATLRVRIGRVVTAIREGDETLVEELVLRLSRMHRWLAPLAFVIGGFAMLFEGLKLLLSNWRLTVIQILPAMWIWLATFNLKLHTLHGKSFHVLRGPILIPIALLVVAITAACFFLNAVFGFAVVQEGGPEVRPAVARAREHLRVILGSGAIVGLGLAFSVLIVTRWGHPWFAIALGIVIGVMTVCYIAVPGRLIGVKSTASRRDKLTSSAVAGAVGAVVCTPPYVLGRIGVLMLGSHYLFIPGLFVLTFAVTAQAGATGAVRSVKMSTKFAAGKPAPAADGGQGEAG